MPLNSYPPSLVRRVVERKLRSSGALRHAKTPKVSSNPLGLTSDDALVIEFQGLKKESRYRMAIAFRQLDLRTDKSRRLLAKARDAMELDLLVACTDDSFSPDELHALKSYRMQIISLSDFRHHGIAYEAVPDFIHVPELEYSSLLEINVAANEIVKRLRKKFHLVLSEVAADSYDDYGTFATREVMRFEDDLLRDTLAALLAGGRGGLAIDVGCGNGRHTIPLARQFKQVIAFDLSGRMVDAARSAVKKPGADVDASAITFYESDVEYEYFPEEQEVVGQADFVCASFGMPSFVEDSNRFLRRIYRWLRPGGRALLTFYNANSLALKLETPWKERALSASIDIDRQALDVALTQDVRFSIYCRPYDHTTRDLVRIPFAILREGTFPHLMSVLPPSVFGTEDRPATDARHVLMRMDRAAAWEKDLSKGHYVFLVVEKDDGASDGFVRVRQFLASSAIPHELLEHGQVVSTSDVRRLLRLPEVAMLKTVVFKHEPTNEFLIGVVGAEERVDSDKLAALAQRPPQEVRLAWAQEVESQLGFPIGGVSPVGYEDNAQVIVDSSIPDRPVDYFYMGAGDNRRTLKVPREALVRLFKRHKIGDITRGRRAKSDS